ncbi:DEAD/DEAH box helicase [Allofustis seminis]|uniref:DEAD/DEAH box helicase n=1 Tax=Allofustis seminis TaxID=166939 RepID=UPI00036C6447|nr:DEAD/DEAH box helicase [Allofustis seminis]
MSENITFKSFNFQPFLYKALDQLQFKQPTPIQSKIIPAIKSGRDIIGQSQTGSGKTHAFLLPLINEVDPYRREVQVVIIAPSRELATQIYQDATQLVANSPEELVINLYVGGTDKKRQIDSLITGQGQPHIVIGTPGRILDLVKENALKTYTAQYMVVDEADMALDAGFLEEVDLIAGTLDTLSQLLVFSATIPTQLEPFLRKYMNQPLELRIESEDKIADTIANYLISTRSHDRRKILYDILTIGSPYLVLIFANTIETVEEVAHYLADKGLKVGVLHGDLTFRERKRIMREIHQLDYQFVVATDLAARGIDVEGVSHVINYEIPQDLSYFVHRVGRTGRMGLEGVAITFYSPDEQESIDKLVASGIVFEEKELKNGELVERRSYQERQNRKNKKEKFEYDPEIASLINKSKKKVKPGYRRKIRQKRKEVNRRNRRLNKKRK